MAETFDQAFWDDRYRSHTRLWSGRPNPQLVAEVADLPAGTALDVGAGEGADAIWLAGRGWEVTGVEISTVALERAAAHALQAGAEVAARLHWVHQDVTDWTPPERHYDLVSAQYLHLPAVARRHLLDRLASAVAPGGHLLIVGHHPSDMQTTVRRPKVAELLFTGDDIAGDLDPAGWEMVTNAAAARTETDPDGRPVTVHDSVLRARRLARRP